MKQVDQLYLRLETENKYTNMHDQDILEAFYEHDDGTLEVVMSGIINEAVLKHMNLNIDSTIMQVMSLNDYLSKLFIRNFEALIYNYIIHILVHLEIGEIEDHEVEEIHALTKCCTLKTNLSILQDTVKRRWHNTKP